MKRIIYIIYFFALPILGQEFQGYQHELQLGTDNDKFITYTSTDRNYTYGINTAYRWRTDNEKTLLSGLFPAHTDNFYSLGLDIKAYTPNYLAKGSEDATSVERPLAGYSFLTFETTYAKANSFWRLGLEAGILGPGSQADEVQNWVHKQITNDVRVDWDGQINDQFGLNLTGVYARHIYGIGWADVYSHTAASIGNIHTYLAPKLNFRLGQFNSVDRSMATRNAVLTDTGKPEYFLEYGVGLKVSGYNATVQGNLFGEDSSTMKTINHGVFLMHFGINLSYKRLGVLFKYQYSTGEFPGTQVHRYGSINLLYRFH